MRTSGGLRWGVFSYNAGMLTDADLEVFRRVLQNSPDAELTGDV
jgi:hypothetical protein